MEFRFKHAVKHAKEGVIDPFASVDLLKYSQQQDPPYIHGIDREVRVGFLPIAGNPPNWGHMLMCFVGIDMAKLDTVVMRCQGQISYKNLLMCERVSIEDRHFMTKESIKDMFPLVRYTDLGSEEDNACEGTEEMHRFLELNSGRRLHIFYLIGAEKEAMM